MALNWKSLVDARAKAGTVGQAWYDTLGADVRKAVSVNDMVSYASGRGYGLGGAWAELAKTLAAGQGGARAYGTGIGGVLSIGEARRIAEEKDKSVAQVMAKALEKGAALGSGLVNQFNGGRLGPNGASDVLYMGDRGTGQALEQLQALRGLQMTRGTVYAGHSTTQNPSYRSNSPNSGSAYVPGSTTYNPIVLPRSVISGVQRVNGGRGAGRKPGTGATSATAAATGGGEVADWENSVNNSNQAIIDSINAQIEANSAQADLYMGQIDSLMQAMQQQAMNPNGGLQSFVPYAVTTTQAPATGAQVTQAITARKKPTDTDLSINPLVGATAGTGLNIGI